MATQKRSLNHLGLGLLVCMGCADEFEREEAVAALEESSEAGEVPGEREAPSAGWLEVEGASIFPYCGAVLIGPHTAITSTSCATSTDRSRLRFGLGVPSGVGVGVRRVTKAASDPLLALLELDTEFGAVSPANMVSDAEARELADGSLVEGVGLLHARRGTSSDRWIWPGTLHPADEAFRVAVSPASASGELRAYANSPNCHGDNGSGIYTQTGALLGIVVAAESSEEEGSPCVDALTLARTRTDVLDGLL